MADVAMPRLSDSMEEGTILKWLKSDGDEVRRGEELVEIETDKANMTYEADTDGVLAIVAQEGDTLAVGEPIARIGAAQETAEEAPATDEPVPEAPEPAQGEPVAEAAEPVAAQAAATHGPVEYDVPQPAAPAHSNGHGSAAPAPQPATVTSNGATDGERIKASPIARRMAREMGVELSALVGTGPGGRIVKADVETAGRDGVPTPTAAPETPAPVAATASVAAPAPEAPAAPTPKVAIPDAPAMAAAGEGGTAKGETTRQQLSRMQQTIARRMAESKATAPDFQLTVEVDMEAAVALGNQLREAAGDGPAPSFNDFAIKAAALALRDFPRVNGSYRDGEFELYSRVNIGIAVAGEDALVVPTIFDADRKTLGTIAADARALAQRARAGVLTPPELAGGTFSISNLGMYGIKRFNAVVNPPQAAILAVGTIEPRAVVREGRIVARTMMDLTITCDHRILNGADGAEFLVRVKERLEQPLSLVL
jgi:pyruvate dehydrogenase E2 component (dihydrolipoamide acetyltransferase)